MPRHFITLLKYSQEEIISILDLADKMRVAWDSRKSLKKLTGKRIALIWDAEGFRNRVAFEIGITSLGGTYTEIPGKLDIRESIEDVSEYLANWFNAIIIRTHSHENIIRLTKQDKIPIINARTDYNHPCEILGDLQYIRTRRKYLDGLKVVFVGEVTNICFSWFEAATRLPIEIVQVSPAAYIINNSKLSKYSLNAIGHISTSSDLETSLKNADIICTDCWPRANNQIEKENIKKLFLPYQITAEKIKVHCPNVIFLPCPPVTRGEEVSNDVLEQYGNDVFQAKGYLLHTQNALLNLLLCKWN